MNGLFSSEFVAMVVGIIVSLLIAVVPQLEGIKAELITVVTVLVGLVIAALGLERAAAARATGMTQAERQTVKSQGAVPTVKYPPQ